MLGQPVYFLTPDVVGVHVTRQARRRRHGHRPRPARARRCCAKPRSSASSSSSTAKGAASLPATDRATIANMAPEYGATMGFFPIDEETCNYLLATGRSEEHVEAFRSYYQAQGLFGIPRAGECDYSQVLELDLGSVQPSVAGPKRPQDRIELADLKTTFRELLAKPVAANGYGEGRRTACPAVYGPARPNLARRGSPAARQPRRVDESEHQRLDRDGDGEQPPDAGPRRQRRAGDGHGDRRGRPRRRSDRRDHLLHEHVESERHARPPGLLAKKAVERGLTVSPKVKASLAPGSRVVTEYLARTGLQPYLDRLGFNLVGYGCTTCIGNSGPLDSAHRRGRHRRTTSSPRASSPATATSRRASTRTSRRTS